ncbi:EAL domain-containing protein [Pseudoduganella aquatica]|uniref:EAL domain-containing protein n=1 Tax=Pseudoduganella aquatica TaxID=2660641 RepID=A0A7X4KL93_9BURK|nr:EAL domain-containing protein [Pseudoduganella aquatica]MYN06535.1 EAL domain-containing protein [Pseudoduganella aquatica]
MASLSELQQAGILIVDDRPANVLLLKAMLEYAGYTRVASTNDPREVVALHRLHRYDLILLDLNMPFMNGFEVLAGLKEVEAGEYLPVLAVTAAPEHKQRALDAGVMDFVCKPFDHGEILARIRNLLEVRLLYTGTRDQGARLACYDALTGLPNRALFQRSLEQMLAAIGGRASAVLMLDLDGFARVNDTLGHAAGDGLLSQFAQRLQQAAPAGSVVSRFGNDEFAIALGGLATPLDAQQVAEQVRHCCTQPFQLAQGEARLTTSIGIALHPADAADAATLMKYASTALHHAKQGGEGNCRFFTDAMDVQAQRRFEFERALRQAVVNGEFELYYQPKVDVASGRMAGAEALLRWNRPGHGAVAPSAFIPLLEETGLIVEVGAWIIDTACRQIALWSARPEGPVPVAVNVASRQFSDNQLQHTVAEAIAAHGIAPGLLSLEVTESALMDDTERTATSLAALRTMGVKVAIDDFGTGYSSLAYLKRFPVDVLKIDIAFIREVTVDPGAAALVDAIIAMAHSLGLEVVAEGVETEAQLAYLARRRCDQIQGYVFSRPLPAMQFQHLLLSAAGLPAPAAGGAPVRTLLLIDDEAHVLSALQRLLRQDGYRVLTANGAAQAFEMLARHEVQLVMCDQRMEEMSGTELLDKIKGMYPDTFRIILSGYTDLATIMDSINRGSLYRFYTKPWDNNMLRENIRAAFRHYWQLHGLSSAGDALCA